MLQPWEWAVRVGIPPGLIDDAPADMGEQYIALLTVWRYTDSFAWRQAWADNVGKLSSGTTGKRLMFWSGLAEKKVGLFGFGHKTDADPMALLRHPWALRKAEFETAYRTVVTDQSVPTNIPDDASRLRQALELGGGLLGAGGIALGLSNPVTGAIVGGAGALVASGALAADFRDGLREDSQKRHFINDISGYVRVYQQEADWRRREQ